MTKQGMLRRLVNVMRKHKRTEDEIQFERQHLSSWWESCKEATPERLDALRSRVAGLIEKAQQDHDTDWYVAMRSLLVEIADHFKTVPINPQSPRSTS
ncbi:MAG: hypothetical protein ACPHN2_04635 [Sinimarinibacterium flocculans]|uniref:hypothetical protein n=1 Tax=Sinimarinibacterium flocculans TaxID=985250 RepID=UPI003C3B85C4